MNKLIKPFAIVCMFLIVSQIFLVSAAVAVDFWETKASMLTVRAGCGSVAASNGLIYTIGGRNWTAFSSSEFVGINEAYNPVTDTWVVKQSMPTCREDFGIVSYQNKIYAIGGRTGFNAEEITGINEVYDVETDTWETKTPMPTAREYMCVEVVNGKIYVIGGVNLLSSEPPYMLNVIEVYDVETDTWSSRSSLPFNILCYTSAVMDNKIYIIADAGPVILTLIYDAEADLLSYGAPIATSSGVVVCATTGERAPKRLYVIGGGSDANKVQIYDPGTETFTVGAPMPTNRSFSSVAVMNDRIYVIGGLGSDGDCAFVANEVYTPAGYNAVPLSTSITVWVTILVAVAISLMLIGIINHVTRTKTRTA
ncbi:MAG: hypothetical protein LBI79_04620 [Nitrososphaerota archaeon]|jgi:N-acetylneuraminic acid mutarotase|nr:hypothetical protein [Nitrososphaerota archaeon]